MIFNSFQFYKRFLSDILFVFIILSTQFILNKKFNSDNIFTLKDIINRLYMSIVFLWTKTSIMILIIKVCNIQIWSRLKSYSASFLSTILTLIIVYLILPLDLYPLNIIFIVIIKYIMFSLIQFSENKIADGLYNIKTSYIFLFIFIVGYIYLALEHKKLYKISFDSPYYEAAIGAGISINLITKFILVLQCTLFDNCFRGGKVLHDIRKKFNIKYLEEYSIPGYVYFFETFFSVFVYDLPYLIENFINKSL